MDCWFQNAKIDDYTCFFPLSKSLLGLCTLNYTILFARPNQIPQNVFNLSLERFSERQVTNCLGLVQTTVMWFSIAIFRPQDAKPRQESVPIIGWKRWFFACFGCWTKCGDPVCFFLTYGYLKFTMSRNLREIGEQECSQTDWTFRQRWWVFLFLDFQGQFLAH